MLLPKILQRQDGATIAYYKSLGRAPGVVFIHGFMSNMTGVKAVCLEQWCQAQKRAFLRFDCFGHGQSSGDFQDGTVGRWVDDTVTVLKELTDGPQILVGSSIGGWIALLAALQWPARIAGFVGLAVAADFTEDIIWRRLSYAQRKEIARHHVLYIPDHDNSESSCIISRALIADGRRHLLLKGNIAVTCPIRLIHGLGDREVPWQTALRLQEKIVSSNVIITLIKDGNHSLSRKKDLEYLIKVVKDLIETVEKENLKYF